MNVDDVTVNDNCWRLLSKKLDQFGWTGDDANTVICAMVTRSNGAGMSSTNYMQVRYIL